MEWLRAKACRSEEADMKNAMALHGRGKVETICNWTKVHGNLWERVQQLFCKLLTNMQLHVAPLFNNNPNRSFSMWPLIRRSLGKKSKEA
eukprot:1157923-Pelagomonas_calceolata.AAC.3